MEKQIQAEFDPNGPEPYGEVRFHLSDGKHYMHWQVTVKQRSKVIDVYYYNPNEFQLEMRGCKLRNRPNKAKQVFDSGKHDVSGWIRCEEMMLRQSFYPVLPVDNLEKLYYNPLRDPHWRRESDSNEFVWDETEYASLITNGKQVYILEEHDCAFDNIREIDPKYIEGFKV